jgi:hypothetical protein
MKYTKTKNKKKFSVLLLTYKHGQFHWTRGASKLGVFCLFFFCFLLLLSVRLLKAFRFLSGKVEKKKLPEGFFFREMLL